MRVESKAQGTKPEVERLTAAAGVERLGGFLLSTFDRLLSREARPLSRVAGLITFKTSDRISG
jgi:hypothetical protein